MTAPVAPEQIEAFRRFSRFYTARIGALSEGLHGSPLSLPEARVFYEIGVAGTTTAGLVAETLGLDAGYLSRLLKALEERGFVERRPDPADGRRQILAHKPSAQPVFDAIQAAARREIGEMLDGLGAAERADLVAAMGRVEALLAPTRPAPEITLRPHRAGDMGWILQAHGEIYTRDYGWTPLFEALVAEILAKFLRDFDPASEHCWIAEMDGRRVGSVFIVRADADTAKLRLLLVHPDARGHGLGRRLVEEAIAFSRARGYRRLVLWTNDPLVAARHIYEKAGFRLVEESRHADFGPEMTGQNWVLDLD
ncbi:bifunctional helix-turn-helix transcriptional regulator/GNAT family N-acetyltransferase [Prosthecodimorpha staleyi]|uniref:Helix-turn-helix domain-containing GNAT family N-acetyltransferase n=1 Tax=Prosthecodimorpha staleyi TaxID=2840188 RepID=A0A947GFL3_9HYPH|nr:helix-turn-helix domain-containing GNAT family N-acetyltransferase [Prosthecodimorpha staleyi]MBT9290705.1 helix-turn-helix domain-containing GNAT family N-acetyltransferase [Prosthecodimorpha staleyi]